MTDIYVIADCSGGFSVLGKRDLQKLLLHTVFDVSSMEELSDFSLHAYLWGETVAEYRDGDKLRAEGTGSLSALVDLISSLPERSRILFMSDGIFDDAYGLKRAIVRRRNMFLTVGVGADADIDVLRDISSLNRTFEPAQLITALKTLCYAGDAV